MRKQTQQQHEHQIGDFFLKPPDHKYATWGICWYENRQTRRITAGSAVLDEALIALAKHVGKVLLTEQQKIKLAADGMPVPKDPPKPNARLIDLMHRYKLAVVDKKPKRRINKGGGLHTAFAGAMRELLAVWKDPWITELDSNKQLEYIRILREERPHPTRGRQYVDESIKKYLGIYWAAMNNAADAKVVSRDAVPTKIKWDVWNPVFNERSIDDLTLEDVGRMINISARHERWWRGMVKKIGTAARPTAAMELTPAQVHLETMTLDLRVPGTPENRKKRRPTIPLSRHFAWHLRQWMFPTGGEPMQPNESFQMWNGQPVVSDNWFFDVAREAGVRCNPYMIRHFVATYIAQHEKDNGWERDSYMGHVPPGSRTGHRYAKFNPRQRRGAADSVDALFEALAPFVTARPLIDIALGTEGLEDQPQPTIWMPTPDGPGTTFLARYAVPKNELSAPMPRQWDGAWQARGMETEHSQVNEGHTYMPRLPDKEPDRS